MQTGGQGTGYMPEDYFKNVQPVLIFDNDSDRAGVQHHLGLGLGPINASSSVWS